MTDKEKQARIRSLGVSGDTLRCGAIVMVLRQQATVTAEDCAREIGLTHQVEAVWRVLEMLTLMAIVRKRKGDDGRARYDYNG